MRSTKTIKMAQMAILIAIVLVMAFTPLGYLKVGVLEITFIPIVVAVAASVLGPAAGAVIGTVFGLTSFYQCFGMNVFGAGLLSINPLYTFIVCVPTRTLCGFLPGLIFKALAKLDKERKLSYYVSSLLVAVCNTVLFVGAIILFFWNTDFLQSYNPAGANVFLFFVAFVGINAVVECLTTMAAGGIVGKAVAKAAVNI